MDTMSWQERLAAVEETMRLISQQTDPQSLVRVYGERIQQLAPIDRRLSLSRRDLEWPQVRITRDTNWPTQLDPWKQKAQLPMVEGGFLAELSYSNETRIIDDLQISPDDPGASYLSGYRSLLAIPMFDGGESVNTVVLLQKKPAAFDRERVPDLVWRSNLFGKATGSLVLKTQLEAALKEVDRELRTVARLQRSLLPQHLPKMNRMDVTVHYQPASRAGGDYYDFFELPNGQWGIFIGDVSGHGTPAAVMMAVTHCIAHSHPGPPSPPGTVLQYLNDHLSQRYTDRIETFVTAFYAVYDPVARKLTYACAGHNPPRLKRCMAGVVVALDKSGGLPLGVMEGTEYPESSMYLQFGDQLILYTDGITEAQNSAGEQFGESRIDDVLAHCGLDSSELLQRLLTTLNDFTGPEPQHDDRTVIVLRAT